MSHSADTASASFDADEVFDGQIDQIGRDDDDRQDDLHLMSDEAEAILARAKHVLIDTHVDLLEGMRCIERSRRAFDRGDEGGLLLITGDSGSGKTTIVREWIRREFQRIRRTTGRTPEISNYGLVLRDGVDGDERPIVFVNAQHSRSTTALATQILRGMGAEVPRALLGHQVLDRLKTQLVGQGTRLLFIDEFHHLVAKSDVLVEELSELVKDLLVETRVQLVVSGMPKAANPVNQNPQLDRRCHDRFCVLPFTWGSEPEFQQEFLEFLGDMEFAMALPEPSNLTDPVRAARIHAATGGILGRVTRLLHKSLEYGLEDGVMHIDDAYLAYTYDTLKRPTDRPNPFRSRSKGEPTARRRPQRPSRTRGALTGRPSAPNFEKTARTV